jgi:AraC-like DNA-binding protein
MIPADFDFRIECPAEPLARFVSGVWYVRGRTPHQRERILASVDAVLLLILGDPLRMTEPREGAVAQELAGAWITGPHERPIVNEPVGETHVIGAIFRPGGVGAFLDGPVEAIANRIVRVDDVASTLSPGQMLLQAVESCRDAASAISKLNQELTARLSPPADHDQWRGVVAALTSPEFQTVGEVQRSVGISRKHFSFQVRRRTGLPPKSLQLIARLRRLLEELDARKPVRWSSEAVGAGYFDQPHAIRDFREFTGMTPVEYVARRREVWGHELEPGEAANFVPELLR